MKPKYPPPEQIQQKLKHKLEERLGWLRNNIKNPQHKVIIETEYSYILNLLTESTCSHCNLLYDPFHKSPYATEIYQDVPAPVMCERPLKKIVVKSIERNKGTTSIGESD